MIAQQPDADAIRAARARIDGVAVRTPLLRLQADTPHPVYLKLETLQPVGSFKVRCAANALAARRDRLDRGAVTASAGNFAQGLAYAGRALGLAVTAFVPETAAASKVEALHRLGATVKAVAYADWWAMLAEPNADPAFIHPVTDPEVIAGNATIALEILEDLPEVAAVIAPYGGGGLSTGIASGLRAAGSRATLVACETEAGAPLRAALAAGAPVEVAFDASTFITGMGGPRVLDAMWPLARRLIDATALVSLDQTANAIRLLVERHHLVVEGAGGAPVAAALKGPLTGPTVCILSGGHLDARHLAAILEGRTP